MPDTKRYGRVHVDVKGRVLGFDEKADKSEPGWINAGIYLLNRPLLLTIPADCAVSLEQEMFPAWIGRGLYGYRSKGRFLDIGTPEAYVLAEQFFAPEIPA
jgi:NDP-sugar pyrophosphorylase family protein